MTNVETSLNQQPPDRGGRVEIKELIDEFYASSHNHSQHSHAQLGTLTSVKSVPDPYGRLLDHESHMTVTVEAFYHSKVDVKVHQYQMRDHWYAREITLVTQSDRRVVQYGIVRLDTTAIEEPVWRKIESRTLPLGRVLIEHNVLREVQLCGLWKVQAGPCLAEKLHRVIGETVYGRTALIHCNGEPAIELLEVVTPVA